jgi:hypothetical protein
MECHLLYEDLEGSFHFKNKFADASIDLLVKMHGMFYIETSKITRVDAW